MKSFLPSILLLILLPILVEAQGENNIWPLNAFKMLDFNASPPLYTDLDIYLYSESPSSAVCDTNGNLLFFSNGSQIADRSAEIMPNGNGLKGDPNFSSMPVLSVPMLGQEGKYYLFTISGPDLFSSYTPRKLYYSIVDMNLNNGKGDIVSAQKNVFLKGNLTGRLVAAQEACGALWVLVHEVDNNQFLAYKITEEGIQAPVVSAIGSVPIGNVDSYQFDGRIHFSSDYKKVISLGGSDGFVELLDFDTKTGQLSNPISLPIEDQTIAIRSGCFSPDGSKLYIVEVLTDGTSPVQRVEYFQFDLSSNDSTQIQNSKTFIATGNGGNIVHMQLGPDEIIYINENRTIASISHPNQLGIAATYQDSVYVHPIDDIGAPYSLVNPIVIPKLAATHHTALFPLDTSLCSASSLSIDLNGQGETYLWQDGSNQATYSIDEPGTYWVDVQYGNCTFTDTIVVSPLTFQINATIHPISNEQSNDGSIMIDHITGGTAPYHLAWNNGQTGSELFNLNMGTYTLTVTDSFDCVYTEDFILDVSTSISSIEADNTKFWISPNPVYDNLQVQFAMPPTGSIQIDIIDLYGRVVQSQKLSDGQFEIAIPQLTAGYYVLQASFGKEFFRTSFVKM